MNSILNALRISPGEESIASIRSCLLRAVTRLFLVLGLVALLMGGYEMWSQGRWPKALVYLVTYLAVVVCFVWEERIPYLGKAATVLLSLFVLAVWILVDLGLSGAGIHLLITFMVLTTTLMGIRLGFFALSLCIAAILAVGSAMSSGWLPIDAEVMANSVRMEAWFTAATLFLIIGGLMVLLPGMLQNSLQASLDKVREKTCDLEMTNALLTRALEERGEMEEKLIRAEHLKAIGLLAGSVAHDLNNILVGVTTYPELLLDDLPEASELREPLTSVKRSGDKAAAIVRDLLTLSRQGTTPKQSMDLNHVIKNYLSSPEFRVLNRSFPSLRVNLHADGNLPSVSGSPLHVSNAIMNLVANAAEAAEGPGRIHIRTFEQELSEPYEGYETVPAGRYAAVEIFDLGPGISPGDLPHIFEPFFTKKKQGTGGTGLGMAIVFGAVKEHKGYIDVVSPSGGGTRFTLYLPASDAEVAASPVDSGDTLPMGRGETVMLADDVRAQREVGEKVLSRLGYRPVTFESGEDALVWCGENRPDIAVLDMIMDPGINGYETLVELRRRFPDIPAVVFSGFTETAPVESALALGRVCFLKKPYTIKEMALALREIS